MMTTINLLTGGFLIIMGFLVKKYPNLIAGYNTMSPEKKGKVNIAGLSSMMRTVFIVMGIAVAAYNPLLPLVGLEQHSSSIMIGIILIGTFIIIIFAQGYKENQDSRKLRKSIRIGIIVLVFIAFAVFTIGRIYYGVSSPEVSVSENKLTISGSYGTTVEVESIELIESIPRIIKRTNGLAYGDTRKGNFNIDEYGKSKLFLQSLEGPFIYVKTKNGVPIFINTGSKIETVELFDNIETEVD